MEAAMATAKQGDTVQIHYKGTLDDGTTFDSSEGRDPLTFTLGQGQVIPGFENAAMGMEVGESKTTRLEVDEAYGERREELLLEVPRDQLPEGLDVEIGMPLQVQQENGQAVPVTITAIEDSSITLDANHPLAGQPLTFEITLVAITP